MSPSVPFCLLPKHILSHVGSIMFVRMHGVVLSATQERKSWQPLLPSHDLFLDFLRGNNRIFVVLIPDEHFGVADARYRDLYPLRQRFIGAIDGSASELGAACRQWMHTYAAGNPYVILDNKCERYATNDSCLVSIPYETGVTKMDLGKALEILNQGSELMIGNTLSNAEKLGVAANLNLSGQYEVASFILDRLIPECRVEDSGFANILGIPQHVKWHRCASFFGVRLRVIVEPATD